MSGGEGGCQVWGWMSGLGRGVRTEGGGVWSEGGGWCEGVSSLKRDVRSGGGEGDPPP